MNLPHPMEIWRGSCRKLLMINDLQCIAGLRKTAAFSHHDAVMKPIESGVARNYNLPGN